jgi:hypothetical protein
MFGADGVGEVGPVGAEAEAGPCWPAGVDEIVSGNDGPAGAGPAERIVV